jgi:putative membrane protein
MPNLSRTGWALWALVAIYAAARVTQAFPSRIPVAAIMALHVFPAFVFALVHGRVVYGWRGILTFTGLCLGIGFVVENVGVLTGFPFGHYHFTHVMGPMLWNVPVLLGMAYVGMGYVSWTLGRLIVGRRLVGLPLAAAFIMVAWDLSMDHVWSNLVHGWVWEQGGTYFGVPLSNYLGWFANVYVIYQLFALYLRGREGADLSSSLPAGFWRSAVAFYAVSAVGNVFVIPPAVRSSFVTDAAGTPWSVGAIVGSAMLVSVFVMGAFALIAYARLGDQAPAR